MVSDVAVVLGKTFACYASLCMKVCRHSCGCMAPFLLETAAHAVIPEPSIAQCGVAHRYVLTI